MSEAPVEHRPKPAPLATTIKSTITAADVTRAYIYGDPSAQERIEIYGRHNADFLRSLVRTE
jgi:hypothetical protein